MLDLVHVGFGTAIPPGLLAGDGGITPALDFTQTIRAHEEVRVVSVAVADLSLGHERAGPIREFVEDIDVIEDIAFVVRELAAACCHRFERQDSVHRPGNLVNTVACLFHQPITG